MRPRLAAAHAAARGFVCELEDGTLLDSPDVDAAEASVGQVLEHGRTLRRHATRERAAKQAARKVAEVLAPLPRDKRMEVLALVQLALGQGKR